jgi:hypothetical protein
MLDNVPALNKGFRGGSRALRTSSLFLERWNIMSPDRQAAGAPVFSLHQEVEGLICARTTFLAEGDPTGYKWAVKYLEGWQHWLRLISIPWFKDAVELWQSELNARLQQEALVKIRDIAKSSSPTAFAAAKYIANKEYDKPKSRRGRPTNAEVERELNLAAARAGAEDEDFTRMKPTLVVSN